MIRNKLLGVLVAILTLAALTTAARAIPIQLSFEASAFPAGAPDDPVSGTIVYDAASLSDPIDSLISIDLTIDGHTYSLLEVGFDNTVFGDPSLSIVGGTIAGLGNLAIGVNDFGIVFDRDSLPTLIVFGYSTSNTGRDFQTRTGTATLTALPVPEPASLALFGAGLAGLGALGWRRRRSRQRASL